MGEPEDPAVVRHKTGVERRRVGVVVGDCARHRVLGLERHRVGEAVEDCGRRSILLVKGVAAAEGLPIDLVEDQKVRRSHRGAADSTAPGQEVRRKVIAADDTCLDVAEVEEAVRERQVEADLRSSGSRLGEDLPRTCLRF